MATRSMARTLEGYALALIGAMAGGVAGGYASVWALERRPRSTRGIEGLPEGLADVGMVLVCGLLGASIGCYALLRLRRHGAAGQTAAALWALTLTSFFLLPLIPLGTFVVLGLWFLFLLLAPLVARAVGERLVRHNGPEEPR